jgi:hypothetical protein
MQRRQERGFSLDFHRAASSPSIHEFVVTEGASNFFADLLEVAIAGILPRDDHHVEYPAKPRVIVAEVFANPPLQSVPLYRSFVHLGCDRYADAASRSVRFLNQQEEMFRIYFLGIVLQAQELTPFLESGRLWKGEFAQLLFARYVST